MFISVVSNNKFVNISKVESNLDFFCRNIQFNIKMLITFLKKVTKKFFIYEKSIIFVITN